MSTKASTAAAPAGLNFAQSQQAEQTQQTQRNQREQQEAAAQVAAANRAAAAARREERRLMSTFRVAAYPEVTKLPQRLNVGRNRDMVGHANYAIRAVQFAPNGRWFATLSSRGIVINSSSAAPGRDRRQRQEDDEAEAGGGAAASGDEQRAAEEEDGEEEELQPYAPIAPFLTSHRGGANATAMAVSPDSRSVALASAHVIDIFDTATWTVRGLLNADHHFQGPFLQLAFNPDSSDVLVAVSQREIVSFSIERMAAHGARATLAADRVGKCCSFCFAGARTWVSAHKAVTAAGDGMIALWHAEGGTMRGAPLVPPRDGTERHSPQSSDGIDVFVVVSSSDGTQLISSHSDSQIRLWSVDKRAQLRTFRCHEALPYSPPEIAAAGGGAASGGGGGDARRSPRRSPGRSPGRQRSPARTSTRRTVNLPLLHNRVLNGAIRCLVLDNSGAVFVSHAGDSSIRQFLVAMDGYEVIEPPLTTSAGISSMALSGSGHQLAVGFNDGSVHLLAQEKFALRRAALLIREHAGGKWAECFSIWNVMVVVALYLA